MAKANDITGQKFSRLLVLGYTGNYTKAKKRMVLCLCDCGKEKEVIASNLTSGMSKSCGCLTVESARERFIVHGLRGHPLYCRWMAMIKRCQNPKSQEYKNYGARGIKVCDRWAKSLLNYAEDMGAPPYESASIDRVDNDGDYSPENCRWSSKKEQSINRRTTKLIKFNGLNLCISDWERHLGFSQGSLKGRFAAGLSVEQALSIPKHKKGVRLL